MDLPKILAVVMIVSTMIVGGVQIDLTHAKATLRNYGLLGRAFVLNFVLLPLFAVLLVRGFHAGADVSTGILLMAMAPGVPFLVNSAARTQGGSLTFALEIAFLFSAISVVTVPITASLVLGPDALGHMPVQKFLTTLLLFQLVPLLGGALIATRLNQQQIEKTAKMFHLAFLVAALALVVILFPKLLLSIESVYGWGHLLIIACIGLFSMAGGWLLGGPDSEYRRTLSIASLMRNIGLCALIATSAFKDTLVAPTIIAYFAITFLMSLPIRSYFRRTKTAPTV